MQQNAILSSIIDIGIVPVIRTHSADGAVKAIEAIYRGGIRSAEITMTVPGAVKALEKIADK
ncbi:MAG: 2-dehydro-3-deoxyphosphogluconate aldolase, partial [Bryobacteraceae bacterium]